MTTLAQPVIIEYELLLAPNVCLVTPSGSHDGQLQPSQEIDHNLDDAQKDLDLLKEQTMNSNDTVHSLVVCRREPSERKRKVPQRFLKESTVHDPLADSVKHLDVSCNTEGDITRVNLALQDQQKVTKTSSIQRPHMHSDGKAKKKAKAAQNDNCDSQQERTRKSSRVVKKKVPFGDIEDDLKTIGNETNEVHVAGGRKKKCNDDDETGKYHTRGRKLKTKITSDANVMRGHSGSKGKRKGTRDKAMSSDSQCHEGPDDTEMKDISSDSQSDKGPGDTRSMIKDIPLDSLSRKNGNLREKTKKSDDIDCSDNELTQLGDSCDEVEPVIHVKSKRKRRKKGEQILPIELSPPYHCPRCDHAPFGNRGGYAYHVLCHDRDPDLSGPPYACGVCSREFSRKDNMKAHMKTHDVDKHTTEKKKTFLCTDCGHKFSQKINMMRHVEEIHRCQSVMTDLMADLGVDTSNLNNHKHQRLSCLVCVETYRKPLPWLHHAQGHLNDAKMDKRLRSELTDIIGKYQWYISDRQDSMYKCNDCDKVFYYHSEFSAHKQHHTSKGDFICTVCGHLYPTRNQLQVHIRKIHQRFKCSECNQRYGSRTDIKDHQVCSHAGSGEVIDMTKKHRVYHCTICQYIANYPYQLRNHLQYEHDMQVSQKLTKPGYLCPRSTCQKRFSTKHNLQMHINTHTKERPFHCPVPDCGYGASDRANILHHGNRIHRDYPKEYFRIRDQQKKLDKSPAATAQPLFVISSPYAVLSSSPGGATRKMQQGRNAAEKKKEKSLQDKTGSENKKDDVVKQNYTAVNVNKPDNTVSVETVRDTSSTITHKKPKSLQHSVLKEDTRSTSCSTPGKITQDSPAVVIATKPGTLDDESPVKVEDEACVEGLYIVPVTIGEVVQVEEMNPQVVYFELKDEDGQQTFPIGDDNPRNLPQEQSVIQSVVQSQSMPIQGQSMVDSAVQGNLGPQSEVDFAVQNLTTLSSYTPVNSNYEISPDSQPACGVHEVVGDGCIMEEIVETSFV